MIDSKGWKATMKTRSLAALMMVVLGFGLMGADVAFAAEGDTDAGSHASGSMMPEELFGGIGAGIGAGLVVMGGAAGIGRIGGSAVESMARQPEVAGSINVAMLITAAMIEGATLFGVVVCLLAI
jgi:F-type H+-transporting ATPase subunit c